MYCLVLEKGMSCLFLSCLVLKRDVGWFRHHDVIGRKLRERENRQRTTAGSHSHLATAVLASESGTTSTFGFTPCSAAKANIFA
eukprot:COSAG06_NODE_1623_length_8895_cov_86.951683_3_plen_84_part_00